MGKKLYIELMLPVDNDLKVRGIKGIRHVSAMGLKESKDLWESMRDNCESKEIDIRCNSSTYNTGMNYFREARIRVTEVAPGSPVRTNLAEQIRSSVTYASLTGQYDISHALIEFLQNYFPEGTQDKEE